MRKLETKRFGGRDVTVYLTESQWRGLLRRFDVEMIHKEGSWFYITVPCMLCLTFSKKRGSDCIGCPLRNIGCLHLVERHGSSALSCATTSDKIGWSGDCDRDIRKDIRNLRKVLLGMPRTRRV